MNDDFFAHRSAIFLQLGFRESALPALKEYLALLWQSNEELNLISRKMTFDELIDNHVIDCLLPLSYFPPGAQNVADFGSGGGLPAIIYALQFPEKNFQLFEKSKLKQAFLKRCQVLAPNIEIHSEIPIGFQGVDAVTARAFKPLDVILDVSRKYYQSKGRYFLLKGRREKIDEELVLARKKVKDLVVDVKPLRSPVLDVERHLLTINLN